MPAAALEDTYSLFQQAQSIASKMVTSATPLIFRVAQLPGEQNKIFRLRYETVVQMGWADVSAFPDGIERDEYDSKAIHLAGWDGETLACTARLILPSPTRRLPTEDAFNLDIEPRGSVVDCSRLIVAPPYRASEHRIFLGLLGAIWLEACRAGFLRICGIQSEAITGLFEKNGIQVLRLAPSRDYFGDSRHPILLDISQTVQNQMKKKI